VIRQIIKRARNYQEKQRVARIEAAWSSVPVESTLLKKYESKDQARQNKICFFATWDPHGFIDPYVLHHLERIRDCGYEIVLVSTSAVMNTADVEKALKLCTTVIHRDNKGLDFASWCLGLKSASTVDRYDSILLANDSCFGPFHDLTGVLRELEAKPNFFSGMTDTWESHYHAQSYFLHFKPGFFKSKFWQEFWSSLSLHYDKDKIIKKYEVGLTHQAIQQGFYPGAYVEYPELRRFCLSLGDSFQYHEMIRHQACNPTIFMWDVLLEKFKFPYLKTELLKINRKGSNKVAFWHDYIPSESRHQIDVIYKYLKRTTPNCPA